MDDSIVTGVQRNPDWTRDELVLALDAYFRVKDSPEDSDRVIAEVSDLLQKLPIHPTRIRNDRFRDLDGVRRRFWYFGRLEAGEDIAGRLRYVEVWKRYSADSESLRLDAGRIAARATEPLVKSKLNAWWQGDSTERFWLEVTGRVDIGANLKAPKANERGKEYWSYSLLRHVRAGDVVFHYDRTKSAIVAVSLATGECWEDVIMWAARGTAARVANVKPHEREGWYVGLERFSRLAQSVSLDQIRDFADTLREKLSALESESGKPIYFPFEFSVRRPPRALQGYLFKLPRFVVELFPSLSAGSDVFSAPAAPQKRVSVLGSEYRRADESMSASARDPFSVDPALIERGTRAHATAQNALADFLNSSGVSPRSSGPDEPSFDLAWEVGGSVWVAEVKSLTKANEEKQLRLGLGQVLRYRDWLHRGLNKPVTAVLMTERRPADESWKALCDALGVALVWPESFAEIRIRHRLLRAGQ